MIADKRAFFPPKFTFRSCEGWEEERDLFGVMIELMEDHLAVTPQSRAQSDPAWKHVRT
eukprot:gene3861-18053_t